MRTNKLLCLILKSKIMDTKRLGTGLLKFYRFLGVLFIIFACLMLYSSIPILLDPEATVRFNGVETTEFSKKMVFIVFSGLFLLMGLVLTFIPKALFQKLFTKNIKVLNKIINGKKDA